MRRATRPLRFVLAALAALAIIQGAAAEQSWVLVNSTRGVAEVLRGDEILARFKGLSFGRGGISALHIRGDETTPLGRFRVTRINRKSAFHVFIGLNYPTLQHVDEAHRRGLIGDTEYGRMLDYALREGQMPQDTVLGGQIGLHGLGDADPVIHARLHWTKGCIAMTDAQIDRLLRLVGVGTTVIVR